MSLDAHLTRPPGESRWLTSESSRAHAQKLRAVVDAIIVGATIIMLIAVPFLGAPRARERWALFLWCFSIWDLVYYVGLWATIHWPTSLRDIDVLFLIPKPWFAELWYPVLVSGATVSAVMLGAQRTSRRHLRRTFAK